MSTVTINLDRRHFLGTAAMTLAAAQFSLTACEDAQANTTKPAEQPTMKPGTNTSFGSLSVEQSIKRLALLEEYIDKRMVGGDFVLEKEL